MMVIRGLLGAGGGAERIFCEMAGMLTAEGYCVTCLHFDNKMGLVHFPLDPAVQLRNLYPPLFSKIGLLSRAMTLAAKIPLLKERLSSRFHWLARNMAFLDALTAQLSSERPDVLISFLPPANTPALLAGARTAVPVIVTNHNVPAHDYDSTERWDQNPLDRRLRSKALYKAAAIHVLFPRFGDWFSPNLQKRIVAIPNYVSPHVWPDHVEEKREKIILGVGRLSGVKNYGDLLEAWSQIAPKFPDWRVVIFGKGRKRGGLERRAAKFGLESSFILGGQTNQIAVEYSRASIFCHPALHEGFGLSVVEAMAHELPTVAFDDCSGVNEFVTDEVNGLLPPRLGGSSALAISLARLIEDDALRARLGAAARRTAFQFSERKFVEHWKALIDEIRDRQKRGKT